MTSKIDQSRQAAICELWGVEPTVALDDFYGMLGLPTRCDDASEIRSALKRVAARLKGAQAKTAPEVWHASTGLFESAKRSLLDPDAKRGYDASIQAVAAESVQLVAAELVSAGQVTGTGGIDFPPGDPNAPLDIGSYLATADDLTNDSDAASQADFDALMNRLLYGDQPPVPTSAKSSRSGNRSTPPTTPTGSAKTGTAKTGSAKLKVAKAGATDRFKASRGGNWKRNAIGAVALGLGVVGLLSLGNWLMNRPAGTPQIADATVNNAPTPTAANAKPAVPRSGGLSKVVIPQGENDPSNMNSDPVPMGDMNGNGMNGEVMGGYVMNDDGATPAITPPMNDSMVNQPATPDPTPEMKPETQPEMAPNPPTNPEPPPQPAKPMLTDDEKARWSAAMKSARELMSQLDFDAARQSLAGVESLNRTDEQTAKWNRQSQLADSAQYFVDALQASVNRMGPAETFMVGSNEIAFVEAKPGSVTMKIAGRVKNEPFADLKLGIAYAIANLSLDSANAKAQAARAAFTIISKQNNGPALTQAEKWIAEAILGGALSDDFAEVMNDSYDL